MMLALRDARSRIDRVMELLAREKPAETEPYEPIVAPAESVTATVGTKLRRWRHANKLTLRQVSSRCEISIAYLSDLERGKLVNPSMRTVRAIAKVMGTDASELLR